MVIWQRVFFYVLTSNTTRIAVAVLALCCPTLKLIVSVVEVLYGLIFSAGTADLSLFLRFHPLRAHRPHRKDHCVSTDHLID